LIWLGRTPDFTAGLIGKLPYIDRGRCRAKTSCGEQDCLFALPRAASQTENTLGSAVQRNPVVPTPLRRFGSTA
jgi:hypothetical protein